jgi:hypothetical protein
MSQFHGRGFFLKSLIIAGLVKKLSEDLVALCLRLQGSRNTRSHLEVLDPEDECTIILRNVGEKSPKDTASNSRRPESPET